MSFNIPQVEGLSPRQQGNKRGTIGRPLPGVAVRVVARGGGVIFGAESSDAQAEPAGTGVGARFPFVFSDWTLGLGSRNMTAEEWARTNHVLNLTLTVALGVVLLGGVAYIGVALASSRSWRVA